MLPRVGSAPNERMFLFPPSLFYFFTFYSFTFARRLR